MALTLSGNSGNTTLDSSNGLTFSDSSNQQYAASPYGLKNRIINGDMRIDQRNAGASFSPTTSSFYGSCDRWASFVSQNSKLTVQQVSDAPTGFTYSLKATSSSAYSIGASDYFDVLQRIEGFNTADLAFGTANAKTITISFWVKSSLTGNFGANICNSAENRFYPFSYTISAANTWEQKTITIAGDTTGTWIGATNGTGLQLIFSLGFGSTYTGGGNAWTASTYYQPTGSTNLVATNAATWQVTGVQLEVGSTATPFERRLYGNELSLCQRYYYRATPSSGGIGQAGAAVFVAPNASEGMGNNVFPVTMRAAPTISFYDNAGTANSVHRFGISDSGATVNPVWVSNNAWLCVTKSNTWATGNVLGALYNASAEL